MKKLAFMSFSGVLMALTLYTQAQYKAGDPASDFKLKNVKGELVSLSQFDDAKGFIVAFWCNTCPVVKKYEQRLIDLHKEFSPKGYPVVAINSNDRGVSPGDSYEEMVKLVKDKKYPFEYLYDETQEVARKFGPTNTPHIYLISKKEGKLVVEYVGAIDNNADDPSAANKKYAADAVRNLLSGEKVAVAGTRAVGCSIKWRKV